MLPVDDKYGGWAASGEIDLMEIVGEQPQEVLNSIHFGSTFPKRSLITTTHALPDGSMVSDWHTYAVEWEPGEIRFFVDDVQTCTYHHWWSCSKLVKGVGAEAKKEADLNPWPAPFDQPFYLVMNVAVGGNFPGAPNDETQLPGRAGGRLRARVRQGRRLRPAQAARQGRDALAEGPPQASGATEETPHDPHARRLRHNARARRSSGAARHSGSTPGVPAPLPLSSQARAALRDEFARGARRRRARPVLQPLPRRPGAGLAGQRSADPRAAEVIRPHTRWIRTFSCTDGHEQTPRIAQRWA